MHKVPCIAKVGRQDPCVILIALRWYDRTVYCEGRETGSVCNIIALRWYDRSVYCKGRETGSVCNIACVIALLRYDRSV